MTSYYSPQPVQRSGLLRKLVLLFLLVVALALGLTILFRAKPGYPSWLQTGLAAASIGVASAFGSRFVLKQRNLFIRFTAALASVMVGLYVLGMASNWRYGIGPLSFWPRTVDWYGIIQAAIGIYVVLLVFRAWRRPPPQVIEVEPRSIEPQLLDLRPNPRPVPARFSRRTMPRSAHQMKHGIALTHLFTPSEPAISVRRTTGRRRKSAVKPISAADLPVRPKRRSRGHSRARVQFAVVEEHRCPFCLEAVCRADPRGVVECDVCHALHHKDCWDITGTCQVPHLNS